MRNLYLHTCFGSVLLLQAEHQPGSSLEIRASRPISTIRFWNKTALATVGVMSSSRALHVLFSWSPRLLRFCIISFAGLGFLLQGNLTVLTAGLHLVMALGHDTPRYGPALLLQLFTIFVLNGYRSKIDFLEC